MTTTEQAVYDRERSERRMVRVESMTTRVRRRWPLVAVAVLVAIALAAINDSRTPDRYVAEAQVYLGSPLTPTGNLLAVAETQMSTAIGLATSREYVRTAAEQADVAPGELRSGLRVRQLEAPVASKQVVQAQIVVVEAHLDDEDAALAGVTAISRQLVADSNGYADAKRTTVQRQVRAARAQLERRTDLRERAEARLTSGSADDFDVWAAIADSANANEELAEIKLAEVEEQLNMLDTVETTRIIAGPDVSRAAPPSRSGAIVVAAGLGLIVGLLVAGLWPMRRSDENS